MIKFTTNLDAYGPSMFPENLQYLPHVGDFIEVKKQCYSLCESKKIPRRLEVVRITHREEFVVVELWYNKTDLALFKEGGSQNLL